VRHLAGLPAAPRVFVANHASYVDALLLATALPADVAFVAKLELAGTPAIGRLLERLGCIFVERTSERGASAGADDLLLRLKAGESLLVFAEGTFFRTPGLLPFHMGAFMAAAMAGAAVVPVAIAGTRDMLPDESHLPRPAAISISFGAALHPADASWQSALELRRGTRTYILSEVREPDLEQRSAGITG